MVKLQKGWVFHMGSVVDPSQGISYRYGFGFWGKCLIFPIDSLSDIQINEGLLRKDSQFKLNIIDKVFDVSLNTSSLNDNLLKIKINGFEGKAVFMMENEDSNLNIENYKSNLYFPFTNSTNALVLSLNDRKAENVLISGGKGSSLASLNHLSEKLKNKINIKIPKGIVVTTNAYKLFVGQYKQINNSINKLKTYVRYEHYI